MSFQIGDRVKRIADEHLGMRVGDVGTVVAITPGGSLVLEEYTGANGPGSHVASKFVLAQRGGQLLLPKSESDPTGKDPHQPGAKLDAGKVELGLILNGMPRALLQVARVATYGANKYTRDGWLSVPDGPRRYTDAMYRHLNAEARGEIHDADTQLEHAAHAAWNALARLELLLRGQGTA